MNNHEIITKEYKNNKIVPVIDYISYLAKYLYGEYQEYIKLMDEDEERNKQFKYEYKEYNYKKIYSTRYEIIIKKHDYKRLNCDSFELFETAIKNGEFTNIEELIIELIIDYNRGKYGNYDEYNNSFIIKFKPFETTFDRKSNYNDDRMNNIEINIRNILEHFPQVDSIFSL